MSRHRKPSEPQWEGWLICNTVGPGVSQGTHGYPSVIRECRAEDPTRQVWVPMPYLDLVEAGRLWPRCWDCQVRLGASVTMHSIAQEQLTSMGRLEEGWRLVESVNRDLRDLHRGSGTPD